MTITLVRRHHVDDVLAAATLAAPAPVAPAGDPVECATCEATAVDEDTARDVDGWVFDVDDRLVCEDCAAFAGPSSAYDRAYWS